MSDQDRRVKEFKELLLLMDEEGLAFVDVMLDELAKKIPNA